MGLHADVIVMGDDLLVVVEGDFDEHRLAFLESLFGIRPVYRKFTSWRDVSFVSGLWLRSDVDEFLFIPKPARVLAKLFWTTKPPPKRRVRDYVHSVACGLRPVFDGIPVMRAFLDANDKGGQYYRVKKSRMFDGPFDYDAATLSEEFKTRYSFSDDDVAELVILLSQSGGPCLVRHPLIEKMEEFDLADIADRRLVA
jgi:hypothetical protein